VLVLSHAQSSRVHQQNHRECQGEVKWERRRKVVDSLTLNCQLQTIAEIENTGCIWNKKKCHFKFQPSIKGNFETCSDFYLI